MSIHKTKTGKWELRWREHGVQRSKTFPTRYLAKEFEKTLSRCSDQNLIHGRMYFGEFTKKWLADYCRLEKTETQWTTDESLIRNHLFPTLRDKRLIDLHARDLNEIKILLKKKNLKPKTINNILAIAKRMLEIAVEWGYLEANPWRGVRRFPLAEQAFDYFSRDELERFLRFCKSHDPRLWEISVVAAHTGMRLGEILGLKRDMIDFELRQITVARNYSQDLGKLFEFTKTKRIRRIPMNDAVLEVMKSKRLMGSQQFLFPAFCTQVTENFKRVCRRAGVKKIRFHDLRHTFASHLAMAGVDLYTISRLLGHTSTNMTMRYAHLSPQFLQDTTNVLVKKNVRKMFGETPGEVVNMLDFQGK